MNARGIDLKKDDRLTDGGVEQTAQKAIFILPCAIGKKGVCDPVSRIMKRVYEANGLVHWKRNRQVRNGVEDIYRISDFCVYVPAVFPSSYAICIQQSYLWH